MSSSIDRGELTNRPRSIEQPTALPDENLHYAALIDTDDTVKYQAPSRVDDFIAKMAEYNKVKAVHLDCSGSARDTSIVGTAYIFDDTQELDLFGRLLQVFLSRFARTIILSPEGHDFYAERIFRF